MVVAQLPSVSVGMKKGDLQLDSDEAAKRLLLITGHLLFIISLVRGHVMLPTVLCFSSCPAVIPPMCNKSLSVIF